MKYYVIAGNHKEYERFIRKKCEDFHNQGFNSISFSDFSYVYDDLVLRGVSEPTGWFYGSWQQRNDIFDIFQVLFTSTTSIDKTKKLREIYERISKI